jgi:predicted CXXCH cytochrome family protein
LLLLFLHPAPGKCTPQASVKFIAPWQGALIEEGPVMVSGSLPADAPRTHFLLNGRPVGGISREGPTFWGAFVPRSGINEFEVRFAETRARVSFVYALKATEQNPYAYHKPFLEGKCAPCHEEAGERAEKKEAETCYRCHPAREALYPYIHGPVAAGKCLVCHDPHGSSFPSLTLARATEMCTSCHDQAIMSRHHTEGRSRVCTLCHDPHYGLRRYLMRAEYW